MILNVEAIFYMRTHKSSFDIDVFIVLFVPIYILPGLFSSMFCVLAITEVKYCEDACGVGLISHISGLIVFVDLLYYISPQLALYVGINLRLYLLLFVAVLIGPCLWSGVQELRGWWKFVTQPGTGLSNKIN